MLKGKLPWYKKIEKKRKPDVVIYANDSGDDYLLRWHLIPRNRFFNIYLHKFIGDDKRVMHDHPWASLSYQLSGTFKEVYLGEDGEVYRRLLDAGGWTYRSSKFCHYIHLFHLNGPEVWTLFMTGPKLKEWGFITENGWEHWTTFVRKHQPNFKGDY